MSATEGRIQLIAWVGDHLNRNWRAWLRFLGDHVPGGRAGRVWWLTLAASLTATAIIPLLPLYAAQSGASLMAVGWMSAAFLGTQLLFSYGSGRLSDRVGTRPMMLIGLITYALCSLGFYLWPNPVAFIWLRGMEGIAAAFFLPAALAYVAHHYPSGERGLRLGQLSASENLGLLLGPAVGGMIQNQWGMPTLFLVLFGVCLLAGTLVFGMPEPTRAVAPEVRETQSGVSQTLLLGAVAFRASSGGFANGMYFTVWPLFMQRMGASTWEVGLSWTLFAVPAVILASWAGRLIDRWNPIVFAIAGGVTSTVMVMGYIRVSDVSTLLGLCFLEGIGFAFAYPAISALTLMVAPQNERGRIIGLVTSIRTLGALAGALVTPWLYEKNPHWCFDFTAFYLLMGVVVLGIAQRLQKLRT
jgi:MFS family permease